MVAPGMPALDGLLAPLVAPGDPKPYVPEQPYVRPLERNVKVGPLWVSSCRCPACGDLFAHVGIVADDASPTCYRCQYATAWPTASAEVREVRTRLAPIVAAYQASLGTSGMSLADQNTIRGRFVNAVTADVHVLLAELKRIYGPSAGNLGGTSGGSAGR